LSEQLNEALSQFRINAAAPRENMAAATVNR